MVPKVNVQRGSAFGVGRGLVGQLGSPFESSTPQGLIKMLPPVVGAGAQGLGTRNTLRLVGDTEL